MTGGVQSGYLSELSIRQHGVPGKPPHLAVAWEFPYPPALAIVGPIMNGPTCDVHWLLWR
jgi:hypothetical protein